MNDSNLSLKEALNTVAMSLKSFSGLIGAKGDKGDTGLTGAIGLKGDTGAIGATGLKGDTGAIGATGLKGDTGLTGATGPKGDTGLTGATGLKGDTGATGATGLKGDIGLTGATGPKGDIGLTGATGAKGDAGATGTTGATGLKGDTGLTGAAGLKGDTGLTGAAGPKGDTGAKGDFSSVHPGFISGRYYPPGFYISSTSGALNTGVVHYSYFFVPKQQNFSAVAFQISATFSAAQNARLAIYNVENGLPSSLVADIGTATITSAIVKELAIPISLLSGWYALAFVVDGSGASFVVPNSTFLVANLIGQATATKSTTGGIRATFAYGAFPAIAPVSNLSYGDVPFIWLKAA